MRLLIMIGRALFYLAFAILLAETIYKHMIKGRWKWNARPLATNNKPQPASKSPSQARR